jgi:hypothetical protein
MNRPVNVADLYSYLATGSRNTGFVAWPVTLADGRAVAGLYRGFGACVVVQRAPRSGQRYKRRITRNAQAAPNA